MEHEYCRTMFKKINWVKQTLQIYWSVWNFAFFLRRFPGVTLKRDGNFIGNHGVYEYSRKRTNPSYHKYIIVTCVIMQRNGAGLHCANSCYWDTSSDGTDFSTSNSKQCIKVLTLINTGSSTYKYESKTMYAIVNVFGLAI
jgi:hypothetical protein